MFFFCSSSRFPCVGVRLVYSSLRCTATFVIRFHRSLLLAFSLHFSSSSAFLRSLFTQSSHLVVTLFIIENLQFYHKCRLTCYVVYVQRIQYSQLLVTFL